MYAARDFDLQCIVSQATKWRVHCIGTLHSEQHCGLVVTNGYVFEVPSLNFGTSSENGQGWVTWQRGYAPGTVIWFCPQKGQ